MGNRAAKDLVAYERIQELEKQLREEQAATAAKNRELIAAKEIVSSLGCSSLAAAGLGSLANEAAKDPLAKDLAAELEVLLDKISQLNADQFSIYKKTGGFLIGVYQVVREFLIEVQRDEKLVLKELFPYLANRGLQLLRCCAHDKPLLSLTLVEIATLGMDILKNAQNLIEAFISIFEDYFQTWKCKELWMATSKLLQKRYKEEQNSDSTLIDLEMLRCYLKNYPSENQVEIKRAELLLSMLSTEPWRDVPFEDINLKRGIETGSFGEVYEVELYGEKLACKQWPASNKNDQLSNESIQLCNEANLQFTLQHPNIVRAVCYCKTSHEFSLVMELMNDSNLSTFLKINNASVSRKRIELTVDIMCQIADAMCYMHNKKIIHRDIKARNILVEREPNLAERLLHVKLGDLGSAKDVEVESDLHTHRVGTPTHWAPEVLEECDNDLAKYGFKADVYSFGMTCYEILAGKSPQPPPPYPSGIENWKAFRPELPDITPYKLQKLITECWDQDPSKRPTFHHILQRSRDLKFGLFKLEPSVPTVPPLVTLPRWPFVVKVEDIKKALETTNLKC